MTTETIAARRQHIQDSAECEGCGATLAACKAARGKDPAAPAWFGCCARGLDLRPCSHKVDPNTLLVLLAEIESGTVRTVEEITPKPKPPGAPGTGMTWCEYLNQGERWQPNGKPMVAIADMDPQWRFNSAAMLLRNAAAYGERYGWSELGTLLGAPDDVQADSERWNEERRRDPQGWMQTTALFRGLVCGMPDTPELLTAVAEQARHYSTCPTRRGAPCACTPGQVADAATIEAIAGTARTIREAKERAAAERLAAEQRAEQQRALREWMAANPGIDPDTNRPWGVDEDGIDHNEPHGSNDHCRFDSCACCGGYHCGLYCAEAHS